MKARALTEILSMPKADRWPVLAEGLALLSEHVRVLRDDTESLIAAGRARSAAIIDAVAAGEAAKVLIILDLARLGWRDQAAAKLLIDEFSQHVPRGIYVEVAEARIATLPELREFVAGLRVSDYLDGPNEVDWVFRNRIEARREETFYVDFVVDDDGQRWVTPQTGTENVPIWAPSRVTDLVGAQSRLGLFSAEALVMISEVWEAIRLNDQTTWSEVAGLNREVLGRAWDREWSNTETAKADWGTVIEQWPLPMYGVDLRRQQVPPAELAEQRARAEYRLNREFYGEDDDWL